MKYQRIYDYNAYQSLEKVAQEFGVSRFRIHQMLNLLKLDQRIIEYLMAMTNPTQINYWTEHRLRKLTLLPQQKQKATLFKDGFLFIWLPYLNAKL